VPIRIGGGTRLKIFEAMAMEKAVVSTTIGAEGLPLTDGLELLVRDEPKAFAEAVIRVLTDQSYAAELGSCAAANVRRKHGWAQASERFASICARSSNQRDYGPAVEKSARAV
jgi:glycosyltransferase involved in cell wall biosynthesis